MDCTKVENHAYLSARKIFVAVLLIFFLIAKCFGNTSEIITVRVAILDELMSQKLSSVTYKDDYLKGIKIASILAKKKNIQVVYHYFDYGKNPLGVINEIKKVKLWHPDFIIGPRSSTTFLLLKNQFKNILVVSPLATSPLIKKMPVNFYSLTHTDNYVDKALAIFTEHYFKNPKGMISIAAQDCIACRDSANLYMQYLKKILPTLKTESEFFISNNVETISLKHLFKNYKKGYLIFSPNISGVSGILIARIANYMHQPDLVFLGDDEWGSRDIAYIGKIKSNYPFEAYHMQDWSIDIPSPLLKEFNSAFEKKYGYIAHDNIAYIAFYTMHSVLSAVDLQSCTNSESVKKCVVTHFELQLKNHRDFKQHYYVFYQYTNSDKPVAIINTQIWKFRRIKT